MSTDPDRAPASRRRRSSEGDSRAQNDLAGTGRSQLGVDGALRGRDVNRPDDQDLAQAEHDLVIVRRRWIPPAR